MSWLHVNQRDCEKQLEALSKDVATCKWQMEAKHAAYLQALRKVEHYQKLTCELSTLLKMSDLERNKHANECREGRININELESMMKEMEDQNLGNVKFQEMLSQLSSELKATQKLLLKKETELVLARGSELRTLTKAEELEIALKFEKEKKEQLLQQVEELKLKKQTENQAKEPHNSSEKYDSNSINNSNQIHNDMELKERNSTDQSVYIEALEMELNQLKQELVKARKGVNGTNGNIEESNNEKSNNHITISLREYESLTRKAEKANDAHSSVVEVGSPSKQALLKMELEAATAKIGELRARNEQALCRVELAEKAKANLEDKLKRYKEKSQRRRAAMVALEESTPKQLTNSSEEITPHTYEPLSKMLNMKF